MRIFPNYQIYITYRCEASSPHIHPVGWCKEHRRTLITPPGLLIMCLLFVIYVNLSLFSCAKEQILWLHHQTMHFWACHYLTCHGYCWYEMIEWSAHTERHCGVCGFLWILLWVMKTVMVLGKGCPLGLLGAVVCMLPTACKQQRLSLELQILVLFYSAS